MRGLGDYDTPDKLKGLLDRLVKERRLPIHMGKIARFSIENEFGFTKYSLSNYYGLDKFEWSKDVVDQFETKLNMEEGGAINGINHDYGTPIRLKNLIKELWKSVDFPIEIFAGNAGHISLIVFQRKFGFPEGSLSGKTEKWAWARKMVAELDADLYKKGIIGTAWERKVPEIHLYLERLVKKKGLPVNELGKLNRKRVMVAFGLASNRDTTTIESRSPKLKALFTEYDELIKESGHSQYQGDAYEEDLRKILDGEEFVLGKSSRLISEKWLAEKLGINGEIIYGSPKLVSIIEEKTKEIHESQRKGKTKKSFIIFGAMRINLGATPYSKKHKRVFRFDSLIPLYGLEFAEKIGTGFIAITNDRKGCPKSYALRIKHFLEWLAKDDNGAKDIVDSLREGKKADQVRFERACMEYHAYLIGGCNAPTSNVLLNIITKFGEARILPLYNFCRKTRKGFDKDRGHKQSILEAARKNDKEKVLSILDDAFKYRNIRLDHGRDTKAFVETLVYEKNCRADLSDDLSEAMLQITDNRLLEIREQASKVFKDWKRTYEGGIKLVADAKPCGEEIANTMEELVDNRQSKAWRDFLFVTFPKEDSHQALCNLLALIKYKFNGIPPNVSTTNDQFWNKQYPRFGGIEKVASYQMPVRMAVSAALTLYLCESGANVAVALALAPDCVRNSDVPAHKKVVSRKDRSKGKTIFDDLPVKSKDKDCISSVSALECLADAVPDINEGQGDSKQYLALHYLKAQAVKLTEYNFRADFKSICNSSGHLRQFHIVPSMIRPTVLLEAQLKNPINLGVAQLIAQHESETTTSGYTNKLPHRIKMEEHILGYQRSLEFVVSQKVAQPHVKIGVSESEWEKRLKQAQRTGLGIFCENREIVDEHGNKTKCINVENCIKCKHDRMLVSADMISIAEMMIWKLSLDKHEDEWLSERLDRWSEVWVPWQAFFHVVLDERMSRGKLSKIKKDATALVAAQMNQEGFVMPEPW